MESYINANKDLWKKYDKIILWGASDGGQRCYNWLKALGRADKIDCFIDRNSVLHGKKLFDKQINPPDYIHSNGYAVIASTLFWPSVKEYLDSNNILNPFFVYFNMETPYKTGPLTAHNVDDLLSLYADDAFTAEMINFNRYAKGNGCHFVLPVDLNLPFFSEAVPYKGYGYWAAKKTNLDIYKNITLIDCGAYIGDSLAVLRDSTASKIVKAYCIEPDPINIEKMKDFLKSRGLLDIAVIIEGGAGERCGKYRLIGADMGVNLSEVEGGDINVITIDSLNLDVAGKLCIKMDIETFEMKALRGAENTIKRYKPELAVCVYHQDSDIYEIPRYIKSIEPAYNCILRDGAHMTCYASVDRYI